MSLLLYKQGLQKRSISTMVFISLLMIVSSPIIMQKIGFWLSFTIFIFVIVILSRHIVAGYSLLVPCSDEIGEVNPNQFTLFESAPICNMNENDSEIFCPVTPEVDPAIISNEIEVFQETIETEIPVVSEANPAIISNEIEAIQEMIEIEIPVAPEGDSAIISNEIEAFQETIEIKIPVVSEVDTAIASDEIEAINETIEIEVEEDQDRFGLQQEELVLQSYTDRMDDEGISEVNIERAELTEVKMEDSENEVCGCESPVLVLLDRSEKELMPLKSPAIVDFSDQEKARQDELLNQGFESKNRGDLTRAIQSFKEASNLTDDKELQSLLILEIVNLMIDEGRYEEAEVFLASRIDICACGPEIYEQYHYLRILHSELLRLGMDSIPLNTVPRWVRMNVSDKMKA